MSVIKDYTENELLQSMKAENEEAFVSFYLSYGSLVSNYITKYVKSSALAEDLCQEIFLKIWETRAQMVEVRALRPWLFTLTRNHTFNFLKRAAVDHTAKAEILRNYQQSHQNVEDALLTRDYQEYIDSVLSTLPLRTREVFRMCREQQRTYDEVAAELGISRNAVKKHMVRSMKVLKGSVEKDLGISLPVLMALVFYS
ncbi:RNA polymerase sigma-70 factor [Olivibacter sp. SDN3]|uniref:RNA polymerase sigma factor n=1 Tax=Olivibacter sp. SDN3 TaxID=2764720 RepID=UPI001651574E|nr:RNA polymerase sigma-70 factor [Olivibacter sp. SDN3]QNL48810.1 RNA polymerase sigma-70 factor [Olivibacter sp. SDN3]